MTLYKSKMLQEIEESQSSEIGIQDLTLATSAIINLVAKQGKQILITNRGVVVAEIVPATNKINNQPLKEKNHENEK